MARAEGYRKARRLMELTKRLGLAGAGASRHGRAYPGIDAEARGQAEAIAARFEACIRLPRALVAANLSATALGGRIALAAGNTV